MKHKLLWVVTAIVSAALIFALLMVNLFTSFTFYYMEHYHSPWMLLRQEKHLVLLSAAAGILLAFTGWVLTAKIRARWVLRFGERRLKIGTFPVLAACVLCVFLVGFGKAVPKVRNYHQNDEQLATVRSLLAQSGKIIHAGGAVTGSDGETYTYTNSLEAFEKNAAAGATFIEMDFRLTSDGHLVCIHNWKKEFRDADGNKVENAVTLDEFLKGSSFGQFTLMTLEDLAEEMRKFPDVHLVVDIKGQDMEKEGYARIAEECSDMMDRIIPQMYHTSQYEWLRNMGYSSIIYSLYKTKKWERSELNLDSFVMKYQLVGITMGKRKANREAFYNRVKALGLPIYVNTVDDPTEAQAYYQKGVDALYTNRVDGW